MTNAILRGKPDAGNPHVRFDEGEVASAKPRRGSLLYKKIWEEMFATGFVSCKLDPSKFSPDDAEYIALSLKDKKRILMDLLDLNQLYVNYCDIDDKIFKISAADKAFTKSFYEGK